MIFSYVITLWDYLQRLADGVRERLFRMCLTARRFEPGIQLVVCVQLASVLVGHGRTGGDLSGQ